MTEGAEMAAARDEEMASAREEATVLTVSKVATNVWMCRFAS